MNGGGETRSKKVDKIGDILTNLPKTEAVYRTRRTRCSSSDGGYSTAAVVLGWGSKVLTSIVSWLEIHTDILHFNFMKTISIFFIS